MVHWWDLVHCGQSTPSCSKKEQLMNVSRPHKTNCLERKQLRRFNFPWCHGGPSTRPPLNEMSLSKGACYQTLNANLLLVLPFMLETLPKPKKGLWPCILGSCEVLSRDSSDITKRSTWASPYYANPLCFQFSMLKFMDVVERIVPPLYVPSRLLIQVQFLNQANIALCNSLAGRSVLGVGSHAWSLSQLALHTPKNPFTVVTLQVKVRACCFVSFLTLYWWRINPTC